jgi:hypothetical protein
MTAIAPRWKLRRHAVFVVSMAFTNAACSKDSSSSDEPGIHCGSSLCKVPAEICCYDYAAETRQCMGPGGPSPVPTLSDASPSSSFSCGASGLEISCDDASDCEAAGHPGYICCGSLLATDEQIMRSRCADISACVGTYDFVLCDPQARPPCSAGEACKPTSSSRAIGYCPK